MTLLYPHYHIRRAQLNPLPFASHHLLLFGIGVQEVNIHVDFRYRSAIRAMPCTAGCQKNTTKHGKMTPVAAGKSSVHGVYQWKHLMMRLKLIKYVTVNGHKNGYKWISTGANCS